MTKEPIPFEKAFARLEKILQKLNDGDVALDDAIQLYEEAHTLMGQCSKSLNQAEKKVEQLIKKRDGTLELNEQGEPNTEEFPS